MISVKIKSADIVFVEKRLKLMASSYQMWAATREAFAMQIASLLELRAAAALPYQTVREGFLWNPKVLGEEGSCAANDPAGAITEEWAKGVVAVALKLIESNVDDPNIFAPPANLFCPFCLGELRAEGPNVVGTLVFVVCQGTCGSCFKIPAVVGAPVKAPDGKNDEG